MVLSASIGFARADGRALLDTYRDSRVRDLPTPACLLNRRTVERNCSAMLRNCASLGVSFRVHIKTHKTVQGTRLQLGSIGQGKVIVSTLMEAMSILPLVEEGLVSDVLYGVPFSHSKIGDLDELDSKIPELRLMMDSEAQLDALITYGHSHTRSKRWSVFVKVDCGYGRAGLPHDSKAFESLVAKLLTDEALEVVEIYGFYSHAGQSYHGESLSSAKDTLFLEIDAANAAAKYAASITHTSNSKRGPTAAAYVISVGATPTAHASEAVRREDLPTLHGDLELHAGCYGFCDLQQLATSLIKYEDIAIKVVTEVISQYPERDEMLIDAGCLALSREVGPIPGFGVVDGPIRSGWIVGRISQEHGILTRHWEAVADRLEEKHAQAAMIAVGEKVLITPQHACITGAQYQWYYVVEEDGLDAKVVDVWVRFNGW